MAEAGRDMGDVPAKDEVYAEAGTGPAAERMTELADQAADHYSEEYVDRTVVLQSWLRMASTTAMRLILVAVVTVALLLLVGRVWTGVLPIILALIVTTVLWPPVAWMRRHGMPASLAALIGLLVPFLVIGGVFAAIAPSVSRQAADLIDQASDGVVKLQRWVQGPPVNLRNEQVDEATERVIGWMQDSSSQIASGLFSGVTAASSVLVTVLLVLVLTFFFLKDGPQFLPWTRRIAGRRLGRHLTEAACRIWATLGGFIRTQAIVSAVDSVLIGIGLLVLQVPLALVLALLTFFGGFIPIVGAFAVGALACLVALVGNGWATALAVLAIIIVVQQLEGNVLQPFLQGRSLQLHAGIILVAVAVGSGLFGLIGAFLAVPVAAVGATLLRYASEQVDLRTGELDPADVEALTPDGALANREAARKVSLYRARADRTD